MLRITTKDEPEALVFRLEGAACGPWVRTLEECWRSAGSAGPTGSEGGRIIRFDLTSVTQIDEAAKEFLAARSREGAELLVAGCWMKSLVAEFAPSPVAVRHCPPARSA